MRQNEKIAAVTASELSSSSPFSTNMAISEKKVRGGELSLPSEGYMLYVTSVCVLYSFV